MKQNSSLKSALWCTTQFEFCKFVIVGIVNTIINYGIFILLLRKVDIIYFIAGAIGFLSGSVSGFFLNRFWTFKCNVPIGTGYSKYFIIQLLCLGAHVITQISVTEILGVPELISQLVGITVTTFMNYFLSRKIVFNKGLD